MPHGPRHCRGILALRAEDPYGWRDSPHDARASGNEATAANAHDERRQIVCENAYRYFRLDREIIAA